MYDQEGLAAGMAGWFFWCNFFLVWVLNLYLGAQMFFLLFVGAEAVFLKFS